MPKINYVYAYKKNNEYMSFKIEPLEIIKYTPNYTSAVCVTRSFILKAWAALGTAVLLQRSHLSANL